MEMVTTCIGTADWDLFIHLLLKQTIPV